MGCMGVMFYYYRKEKPKTGADFLTSSAGLAKTISVTLRVRGVRWKD